MTTNAVWMFTPGKIEGTQRPSRFQKVKQSCPGESRSRLKQSCPWTAEDRREYSKTDKIGGGRDNGRSGVGTVQGH